MMAARYAIDSNVLLYLLSPDAEYADIAESLITKDAVLSVQVLNELTNVARRKFKFSWQQIDEFLGDIRLICPTVALTVETHDRARAIAERYQLSFYDALIVAAALLAEARTLYSEDMQHGMIIDGALAIKNPFRKKTR